MRLSEFNAYSHNSTHSLTLSYFNACSPISMHALRFQYMLSDFNACIHKLTIHRQSGHGQHVAQQHYAINADFLRSLNPKMIKSFENASLAWHELFTTHESQQIENQPISNQSKKHSRAISN